jgi:hypothetical protein
MAKLSRTNPELFENKTLGEATTSPFLDQVEAQQREDFNARYAKREPRNVLALNRTPGKFKPSGTVPSDYKDEIAFEGEENEREDSPVDEDFGVTPAYTQQKEDTEDSTDSAYPFTSNKDA